MLVGLMLALQSIFRRQDMSLLLLQLDSYTQLGLLLLLLHQYQYFDKGVYKGGFASKTLKKFSEIVLDCDQAKGECYHLRSSFESSKKESRIEAYEKLCTLLTEYCNAFTPLNWYDCIPGDTIEDKRRFLKEDKHFSNILQSLPFLPPCIIGDASFKYLICPDVFYYMTHPNEWTSVFTDRVKELYPTDTDYRHDLRSFQIRCKVIPAIV